MARKTLRTCVLIGVATQLCSARSIDIQNDVPQVLVRSNTCSEIPTTLHLSDPPYQNYFYSDCHAATQVVVTSPEPDSNLTLIGPRLLVAWPAGDSGAVAYFEPQNKNNGTLAIKLVDFTGNSGSSIPLHPIYQPATPNPINGVSSLINFNSSATLTIPILGSIRTIRDFSEGPSIIVPFIQSAIRFTCLNGGGTELQRTWLDNVTTTTLSFTPHGNQGETTAIKVLPNGNTTITFTPGTYRFAASFNYPQLSQVPASSLYKPSSQQLITSQPSLTKALSFLTHTNKLLAGAWRFLTYFGRDSMISLSLLQPILRTGTSSPTEAALAAVLERLNSSNAAVCHEETIGDYATYLHLTSDNTTSTAPSCTYIMIDTDFYLPIQLRDYFLQNPSRRNVFLSKEAPVSPDFGNAGSTYGALATANAARILRLTAPFVKSRTQANLLHLHPDQPVGNWRDSNNGLGSGRIPFDVNTALAPAALRAISELAASGFYDGYGSETTWHRKAKRAARIWERRTLDFFSLRLPAERAKRALRTYVSQANFSGPARESTVSEAPARRGGGVHYYALALEGGTPEAGDAQPKVQVMHSDTAFRLFFLPWDAQYSARSSEGVEAEGAFLRATARSVTTPFPGGLSTGVGMVVANPAYGALASRAYSENFTTADYHGTVVWSFPMAMMAKGLEKHLLLCGDVSGDESGSEKKKREGKPAYCSDSHGTYNQLKKAYNHLWDLIEKNRQYLSEEVWSWRYVNGGYQYLPLSALSPTESDIRQLWSLTFLAVGRDESLR